jgi:hypothetical protein
LFVTGNQWLLTEFPVESGAHPALADFHWHSASFNSLQYQPSIMLAPLDITSFRWESSNSAGYYCNAVASTTAHWIPP